MAIVYLATNLINGKRYIGATSRALSARVDGHVATSRKTKPTTSYFAHAMKKYGWEMFRFSVLAKYETKEEAFREEARLIEIMKPEYNLRKGGIGLSSFRRSEETKAKLSAMKLGKKIRPKRKPISAEVRKKMSEAALNRTDGSWDKYRAMGPKAFARRVRCLDDGLEFESASAAARHFGAPKSAVIELCLKRPFRHTVSGRVFEYVQSRRANTN